jgi:hypothetical protein
MTTITARRLTQPCTIAYRDDGPPDEHNDPTDIWTNVQTLCIFQQRARAALGDQGQVSMETWWVWLDPNERVPANGDRLFVGGMELGFRADGWLAHDLQGNPDHIAATCGHLEGI